MMVQEFYLPSWNWRFIVHYDVTPADCDEILDTVRDCGGSRAMLRRLHDSIARGARNSGATCTIDSARVTVMVIGRTSSAAEFWNTFDHEKGHAATHVASVLGLDPEGESRQYLSGELARRCFPVAKRFVCDRCI